MVTYMTSVHNHEHHAREGELLIGAGTVLSADQAARAIDAGARFVVSPGFDAGNVGGYLALPNVVAVGGTWMVPKALVDAGDWPAVERLTRQAVATVREGAAA